MQLSTGSKFNHLLVIVDGYSKYAICIAKPGNHNNTCAINTYYQYVYLYFVVLEDIVNDQDTIFTSFQWLQFCKTQHINQSMLTANHA